MHVLLDGYQGNLRCVHLRWRGSGNLLPMLFIRVHAILLAAAVFRLTGGLNGSTIGP